MKKREKKAVEKAIEATDSESELTPPAHSIPPKPVEETANDKATPDVFEILSQPDEKAAEPTPNDTLPSDP